MIFSIIIFLLVMRFIRGFIGFLFMPPMPHHHMWNDPFIHGPHGPFGGPHGPVGPRF